MNISSHGDEDACSRTSWPQSVYKAVAGAGPPPSLFVVATFRAKSYLLPLTYPAGQWAMRASGPPHQNRERTRRVIQLRPQWLPYNKKIPFFKRAEFFYLLMPISKANLQVSERPLARTTCPDLQLSDAVKVLHHNAVLLL